MLRGIEQGKEGKPRCDIEFTLDSKGELSVRATDRKTGATENIEIKRPKQFSDDQVSTMKNEINGIPRAKFKKVENKLEFPVKRMKKEEEQNEEQYKFPEIYWNDDAEEAPNELKIAETI